MTFWILNVLQKLIQIWIVRADAAKEKEDKDKIRKEGLGVFHNVLHYMRIYDVLKGAYMSYKVFKNNENIKNIP